VGELTDKLGVTSPSPNEGEPVGGPHGHRHPPHTSAQHVSR
jgi:hypothetical protein